MNRFLVLFILTLFSSNISLSQEQSGYIRFMGKVLRESKPLSGVKIEVFKDSVLVDGLISTSSGKFDFHLDYNFVFVMKISKYDCTTMTIKIDTHVPERERLIINVNEFNINLLVQDSLNTKASKVPSAIISYNHSDEAFKFDKSAYYTLGVDKFGEREFEDAIKCFSKSIIMEYRLLESYYNRGACYKNIGNVKSACSDWLKVKELGSNDSDVLLINYCEGITDSIH